MKKLLSMLSLCVACVFVCAQNSNDELLKKLVEKNVLTQGEADSLRMSTVTAKTETNTVEKVRKAFNTPYMQFGGYGLFVYKYSDIAEVKHNAEPKVVFLSMRGELTKNLKYFILTEFVNPRVYEFYGDWTPAEYFNLRFGQMKTPLSIENQMSLTTIEAILNTRSTSALMGMRDDVAWLQNGINNTGRDIGVKAYGGLLKRDTHNLVNYDIGIYQGTGLNTSENNNSKDVAMNLLFQPIKDFRIGGGAYFGEANYVKPGDVKVDSHVRNRWMVNADYKTDRFYTRTEWIKANDGGISKEGLYVLGLYYLLPQKLNAFAKADYLNKDKKSNSELIEYTLGVNYYFYGLCRLQLNYIYSDYSANWNLPCSNTVMGQLQIVF